MPAACESWELVRKGVLDQIGTHHHEFEALRDCLTNIDRYMESAEATKLGASDTEPCWVLHDLLRNLFQGGVDREPLGANGWQIYTSMDGADRVAEMLDGLWSVLVSAYFKVPVSDRAMVYELFSKFADRVDWEI